VSVLTLFEEVDIDMIEIEGCRIDACENKILRSRENNVNIYHFDRPGV
jgi:hypothetical protein